MIAKILFPVQLPNKILSTLQATKKFAKFLTAIIGVVLSCHAKLPMFVRGNLVPKPVNNPTQVTVTTD